MPCLQQSAVKRNAGICHELVVPCIAFQSLPTSLIAVIDARMRPD